MTQDPGAGRMLGDRYVLVAVIGRGGMAEWWPQLSGKEAILRAALAQALAPDATLLLWYPIKSWSRPHVMQRALREAGVPGTTLDLITLPLEEKRKIKIDQNKIGYFEVASSVTRHSKLAAGAKPNLYAAFCFRGELAPDDPDILAGVPYRALNRWPENLPGFREGLVAYSEAMERLGEQLLQ